MPYTLEDLAKANERLEAARRRADSDSSNNPNKGLADVRAAGREIELIIKGLKAQGLIPKTDQENLEAEIDRSFPNAESKQIVNHHGKRYQLRFTPAEMSRSGKNVMRWHRRWEEITT